jgi:hypothetical protein
VARADRRARSALILGGLRWRAGASLSMLVVAVGAIAAGTFGPVYLGEADHSVLLSTLAEAPVGNNGITLLPSRGPDARTRLLRVSDEASHLFGSPTFGGRALLGSPIVTEDIDDHSAHQRSALRVRPGCPHRRVPAPLVRLGRLSRGARIGGRQYPQRPGTGPAHR